MSNEEKLEKLLAIDKIIKSGWGGINRLGHIVDRRLFKEAVPIPENKLMGTPAPKELTLTDK